MEQIVHKIATGDIGPGDQLPPVRQLADALEVNFNTVARAYRLLDEAGVISTQHGRGTYILEVDEDREKRQLKREDLVRLTIRYVTEARKLGFPPEVIESTVAQILREPPEE
ncbi:MAG: GntR family transcriptional regulator [Anaerolineales bacterium]|nr:GntR family transcriptional regulator [Anaerolineales bacterium]